MIEYASEGERFLIAYAKMWKMAYEAIGPKEQKNEQHEPESQREIQPDPGTR